MIDLQRHPLGLNVNAKKVLHHMANVPHASRVVKKRAGIALISTMQKIITIVSWMTLTN